MEAGSDMKSAIGLWVADNSGAFCCKFSFKFSQLQRSVSTLNTTPKHKKSYSNSYSFKICLRSVRFCFHSSEVNNAKLLKWWQLAIGIVNNINSGLLSVKWSLSIGWTPNMLSFYITLPHEAQKNTNCHGCVQNHFLYHSVNLFISAARFDVLSWGSFGICSVLEPAPSGQSKNCNFILLSQINCHKYYGTVWTF